MDTATATVILPIKAPEMSLHDADVKLPLLTETGSTATLFEIADINLPKIIVTAPATPPPSTIHDDQQNLPPKPQLTIKFFDDSRVCQDSDPNSYANYLYLPHLDVLITDWLKNFNEEALRDGFRDLVGLDEVSTVAVERLFEGVMRTSGGAVAKTARALPGVIRGSGGGVCCEIVMRSLKTLVSKIKETAKSIPKVYKYTGIIYGVLLVEFEKEFSILQLAIMFEEFIRDDTEDMLMLKVVSQVLCAVQVMRGDDYLVALYVRQRIPLQVFWAAGSRSDDVVDDFLQNNSLDCLLNIRFEG
ncbi:hypothetical protein HK100_000763 [Physocladia obscura]|uniref:Uncharacterized protein n=1 Tax=Physocladia obscura TaxID=109957 RepID=A0AAD5SXY0_9FUNG|nr:hypothetical protein HK100_000763 [Physocladia obscura]